MTGCYTPDGQHRMNGDECTICGRGFAPATVTYGPGRGALTTGELDALRRTPDTYAPAPQVPPVPATPPQVPTPSPAPRPRRRHGFLKFVAGATMIIAAFGGIGALTSVQAEESSTTKISSCYTQESAVGPESVCQWTGQGRNYISTNHGTKIYYSKDK